MHVWNSPQNRLLCAESLEDRKLLSGDPSIGGHDVTDRAAESAPAIALRPSDGRVSVIEIGWETDDDDDSVAVAPQQLPKAVRAALEAQFPGARVIEAEYSEEDIGPEFGITARFSGRLIEASFTPDGRVIEMEEMVSPGSLPPAVLDWVRENFPGARIDEAALIPDGGAVNFEVLIASAGGDEIEAVLRIDHGQAPIAREAHDEASGLVEQDSIPAIRKKQGDWGWEISTEPTAADPLTESIDGALRPLEVAGDAPREAADIAQNGEILAAVEGILHISPAPVATEALRALISGRPGVVMLPEAAGLLMDVLQADLASIEEELGQILEGADSLLAEVVGETARRSAGMRLVAMAALWAGLHLFLLESRSPGRRVLHYLLGPVARPTKSMGRASRRP